MSIEEYENSTICYNTGIFMCGVAHRKSIIEKIKEHEKKSKIKLDILQW